MKLFITLIRTSLFILAVSYNTNLIYAQGNNKTTKILWKKVFCDENLGCSPGAVAFDSTNNTLLIIGTSFHSEIPFHPKSLSEGKFRLCEINEDGNKVGDIVLKEAPKDNPMVILQAASSIKNLHISIDRNIHAIGQFDGLTQSFLTMNQKGGIVSIKYIPDKSPEEKYIKILRMVNLPNDSFLLLGRDEKGHSLIIKVDSEGNRIWKRTYDLAQTEVFTDGVSVGDKGDFLVTGFAMRLEGQSFWGPSDVWILKCDAKGDIISEELFPGRYPQVCRLNSGNFVVLYDKSTDMKTADYRIKAFDSNLTVLWEKEFPGNFPLDPFKIKATPHNGFVIAGHVGDNHLGVYEYNEKGEELSSISMEENFYPYTTSLVCAKEKAFVVLQVFSKEHGTYEIEVIAIELNK